MSTRKLQRQMAKANPPGTPTPVLLVAVIRKSRVGYTAVIDAINPQDNTVREIHGTCSADDESQAIAKAHEIMKAEMDTVHGIRLIVEGVKGQ